MRKITLGIFATMLVGGLAGCASTSLYKATPEPGFQSGKIHKAMVISMNSLPEVRVKVENEFVRQWRKRGVDAIASHEALPTGTPMEKSRVAAIAQAQGFDTVLVSRMLGMQKIDPQIRGQEFEVGDSSADANLSQYFQATVASPAYAENYQMAAVTANVYEVSSEKKVWSAVTQTLVSKGLPAHIKDYVNVILKNLYK